MAASPAEKWRGILLSSRYRVQRKLGSGSMGTVYLAHDARLDRLLALKLLNVQRMGSEAVARLQEEFRAIASLHHPQIAKAYDFGYTEAEPTVVHPFGQLARVPFYTSEYIEGLPLPPGPPGPEGQASPREFLKPFFDLLDALHYLHAHQMLHLDIHAGNLIVAKDSKRGSVLIDFGLVVPVSGAESTRLLRLRSSFAPELVADETPAPPADLYSVGRLLLYRLTGSGEGEARLPREIPGLGPRLTLELERILSKALQREPERRFQSAAEFREALSSALGGSSKAPNLLEPGEVTLGRSPELEALEELLRRAVAAEPAGIWFFGPQGVGKTRLLTEARWRAQLRGLEVVEARFYADPASEPLLLKAFKEAGGKDEVSLKWLEALKAGHGGSSAERARRAAEAFFLDDGHPLLLLLDDLEHADRESRLLAEALLSEAVRRSSQGVFGRGLGIVSASTKAPLPSLKSIGRKVTPLPSRDSEQLLFTLLRPLSAPRSLVRRFARAARGYPLRLRQAARVLHKQWGHGKTIPASAAVPTGVFGIAGGKKMVSGRALQVLRAFSVLERPASRREIAQASGMSEDLIRPILRRLSREEILDRRSSFYSFTSAELARDLRATVSRRELLRIHERMAKFLRSAGKADQPHLWVSECLARHLLRAGRQVEGRQVALKTAETLRRKGLLENAVRLLSEAALQETSRSFRLKLAEEISSLHELAGDHQEGIAVLEPVICGKLGSLTAAKTVRIRRRLGVHFHRAGLVEKALTLFEEVRALASPARDVQELVFVESEIAELHTFRGEYAKAESACRRGLDLLGKSRNLTNEFHARTEVTLRASLGHLALRRMNLEEAQRELEGALKQARSCGTTSVQALLLNNLGIVYNQGNDLTRATDCFQHAERLLMALGERREVVQIRCNLAVIAAKTGQADQAREEIERAAELLVHYPGRRLEFYLGMARGIVAHLLGDMGLAARELPEALALGRKLGDTQFVLMGEVYLAEAHLALGYYYEANERLRSAAGNDLKELPPGLQRMVHSRLFLLEALLGRSRAADASRRALEAIPRTNVELLEAWNDLFLAQATSLSGKPSDEVFELARGIFSRLGIPAGRRLAQVGLLHQAILRSDTNRMRAQIKAVHAAGESAHKLLSVLEPCALAGALFALGEEERSKSALEEALGAIVGLRFLEIDWAIEFLRARQAERDGDRERARHHLQRSLHTRDLLAGSMPPRFRQKFLAHPRFSQLTHLAVRLEKPRPSPRPTKLAGEISGFQGLLGRSAVMLQVFKKIEAVRDQEIPVLITGETGTGKELVARAIHQTSPRRRGPFFALHCASLPSELFESELFGYEAGAFTGAEEPHPGLLEHLAGGTLLLDEVSSLALSIQAKLLRVLDTRKVRPLGGVTNRPVDIRFLASSSEDLAALVASGNFRADFYYRLQGLEIELPPLRMRREDIPLLARHFLARHSRRLERGPAILTKDGLTLLQGHDWPGNVRELEMTLLRALISASGASPIGVEALRAALPKRLASTLFPEDLFSGRDFWELKKEFERTYLTRLFRETKGDIEKMLETLQVKRASLYNWFRRVGINAQRLRREIAGKP